MTYSFNIASVNATFGAVIRGVKLAALDDTTFRDLYTVWLKYALLIFPDQHLSRAEQIAFAKRFGNLEFEFAAISNVKTDGSFINEVHNSDMMKILQGNMDWHCDSTYMPVQAKGAGLEKTLQFEKAKGRVTSSCTYSYCNSKPSVTITALIMRLLS